MARLGMALLLGIWALTATGTEAVESRSQYVRPCSFWNYSSAAGGYVCNNPGFRIEVMEAYEVEQYVSELERKIDDLERRVQALESATAKD